MKLQTKIPAWENIVNVEMKGSSVIKTGKKPAEHIIHTKVT